MTCDEFRQMLDNYEGLTETEKLIMTAHTAQCRECRREMDFMLSIIGTAKSLPKINPPEDFLDKLNARIDLEAVRERRMERKRRRLLRMDWKRYGSLAACLVLIAVIGVNGKSLVSRMTDGGNDVIVSETVSYGGQGNVAEETPDVVNGDVSIPEPEETTAAGNTGDEAVQSAVPEKTAENNPVNTAAPVQSSRPTVQRTAVPISSVQPKAEQQAVTAYEANISEPAAQTPEAAVASPSAEPYTVARDNYRIPIESVPYGDKNTVDKTDDKNSVNGYSLDEGKAALALGMYTPIDKDGNPTDFEFDESKIANVPSGSSILVSSKDEEKVKTLMNRYITGNYGVYYMTTENKLNEFLEEMDKAGINYEKYISNSLDRVSFKLVVIS